MRLPYAEVEFTSKGDLADQQQLTAAVTSVREAGATDVLLIAHGWNNDMPVARRLFEQLTASLADRLGDSAVKVAVVGLLWPSVRWADEDDLAGGGASASDPRSALLAAIEESVEDPSVAAALRAATDDLEGSKHAQEAFVAALRDILPVDDGRDEEPVPEALAAGEAGSLFTAVEEVESASDDDSAFTAVADVPELPPGQAPDLLAQEATEATGFRLLSPLVLARRLLNVATYYTMKDRAGVVGARGVTPVLARLGKDLPDVRVHLAGHSFGARVVSAAAAASAVPIGSVTLLQGAFSHFGFAEDYGRSGKDGAFRRALTNGRLQGPVVITYTANDRAVRTAYAIASRIARQTGADFGGGANDPYGGIGANGAQGTAEAEDGVLEGVDGRYAFRPGRVYNLRADRFIGGHSKITGPEVAHALVSAMTAGR